MNTNELHIAATAGGLPPGAMQAVLDALDCQIALITQSGDAIVVNEAWRRMDAVNREAQEISAGVHEVLARRVNRFSCEYPCHVHGQEQWFQMNAIACEISGAPHAVVVHHSITPATRKTEDELRALLTRKEEFLATLLHELRNPLAPIANALEMLGRYPADPQSIARARGIIQRQLRQITRLVDDLFDLSRSQRATVEMRRARLDIADVLPVSIDSAQPLIDLRRHTLTEKIVPGYFIVYADATRLAQVLTNLLINAAKYTPPGGHISIIAERTPTDVLVHVRDSGVGIAREHLSRVFDLFAQAESTPEERMGGLGIGLALARELMHLQGGAITVQSEGPGRGSEFTISLPRADDATEVPHDAQPG